MRWVRQLARNLLFRKQQKNNIRKLPNAAHRGNMDVVLDKIYMDDYLDSLDAPHGAISRAKNLVVLLKLGGFIFTNSISNTHTCFMKLKTMTNYPSLK